MKCRECSHWEMLPRDSYQVPKGWGQCERASSEDGEPTSEGTKMFAYDASSYRAGLWTAPNFGCVEFKGK